jgi:hypothetical protein
MSQRLTGIHLGFSTLGFSLIPPCLHGHDLSKFSDCFAGFSRGNRRSAGEHVLLQVFDNLLALVVIDFSPRLKINE